MPSSRETARYYERSDDANDEQMYLRAARTAVQSNLFAFSLWWGYGDGKGSDLVEMIKEELISAGLIRDETKDQRPKSKAKIPHSLRLAVHRRDGFTCAICGTGEQLSMDHIIPESRGGPTTLENLRVLCRPCNSRKGAAL